MQERVFESVLGVSRRWGEMWAVATRMVGRGMMLVLQEIRKAT